MEMVLVNAKHLKYMPGRKTDLKDCQWLQQLHRYGLLNGSFRPTQDICALRSLMRHRENLGHSGGREVQHRQQAPQQMNVHLHHAVSDLDGQTGLKIVDAILAGQRDPKKLVELRDEKCHKTTPEELEAALVGGLAGGAFVCPEASARDLPASGRARRERDCRRIWVPNCSGFAGWI